MTYFPRFATFSVLSWAFFIFGAFPRDFLLCFRGSPVNYSDILGNFKGVGRVVEPTLDKGRNTQDKSEFGSKKRSTRGLPRRSPILVLLSPKHA